MNQIDSKYDQIDKLFDYEDFESIQELISSGFTSAEIAYYTIKIERLKGNHRNALILLYEISIETIEDQYLQTEFLLEQFYINWQLGNTNIFVPLLPIIEEKIFQLDTTTNRCLRMLATYYHLKASSLVVLNLISIEESTKIFLKSVEIKQKLGAKRELALSYNNLGVGKLISNDFEEANEYFIKGLKIGYELNNIYQIGLSLINLVELLVQNEKSNDLNNYYMQLELLYTKYSSHDWIKLWYKFATALILSKSTKIRDKLKAEGIFAEIIEDKLMSFSIYEKSIFNLCNLYLFQLQFEFDEITYQNFTLLINKLVMFGKDTRYENIGLKASFLKSKLLAMEGKINEAKNILLQIKKQFTETTDYELLKLTSMELEILLNQEKIMDVIPKGNIQDEIKNQSISNLLYNFISTNPKIIEKNEIPVAFILLNIDGNQLFSKLFIEETEMNTHLVGNFIVAFNIIANHIFESDDGYIEKITQEEFNITIKKETDLLYCYIHRGDTNMTIFRLDQLINHFSFVFSEHREFIVIDYELKNKLDHIMDNIFQPLLEEI